MSQQAFLDAALEAARTAGDILRHYFAKPPKVRLKEDNSPVTVADEEAEHAIRNVLSRVFPDHGFYGEEHGRQNADAEYVWLIDPLDGTKSFIRGTPYFSVQIALMHRGRIIVGVSNAPLCNELAAATRSGGATLNNAPIEVSSINTLRNAHLSTGNLASLARDAKAWRQYGALVQRMNRLRGYGDFLHYHLLASGRLDVVLESDVNIFDIAALSLVVEEAGGKFTDLKGHPVGLETTTVLASNGRLHGQIGKLLSPPQVQRKKTIHAK